MTTIKAKELMELVEEPRVLVFVGTLVGGELQWGLETRDFPNTDFGEAMKGLADCARKIITRESVEGRKEAIAGVDAGFDRGMELLKEAENGPPMGQ